MDLSAGRNFPRISLADLGLPRLALPGTDHDPLRPKGVKPFEVTNLAEIVAELGQDIEANIELFTAAQVNVSLGISDPFLESADKRPGRPVLIAYTIIDHQYVVPSFTAPGVTGAGFERFRSGYAAPALTLQPDGIWSMNMVMDEDAFQESLQHALDMVRNGGPIAKAIPPLFMLAPKQSGADLPEGSSILTRIEKGIRMLAEEHSGAHLPRGCVPSGDFSADIPVVGLRILERGPRGCRIEARAHMEEYGMRHDEAFHVAFRLSRDGLLQTVVTGIVEPPPWRLSNSRARR